MITYAHTQAQTLVHTPILTHIHSQSGIGAGASVLFNLFSF